MTETRTTVVIDRTKWMRVVRRNSEGTRRDVLDGTTARTLGSTEGATLLTCRGTMCCLGFISKTLLDGVCYSEVIDHLLMDVGTPAAILIKAAYLTKNGYVIDPNALVKALGPLLRPAFGHDSDPGVCEASPCRNSELVEAAIRLNDLVSCGGELCDQAVKTREEELVAMFAEHGIDLVFEGEDCTNGSR